MENGFLLKHCFTFSLFPLHIVTSVNCRIITNTFNSNTIYTGKNKQTKKTECVALHVDLSGAPTTVLQVEKVSLEPWILAEWKNNI